MRKNGVPRPRPLRHPVSFPITIKCHRHCGRLPFPTARLESRVSTQSPISTVKSVLKRIWLHHLLETLLFVPAPPMRRCRRFNECSVERAPMKCRQWLDRIAFVPSHCSMTCVVGVNVDIIQSLTLNTFRFTWFQWKNGWHIWMDRVGITKQSCFGHGVISHFVAVTVCWCASIYGAGARAVAAIHSE